MKLKIIFGCLIALNACGLALGQGYNFYNPCGYYGYGGYYGYSPDYVPYFAMHPPVYYNYPIARTYGDSPFPYLPGITALQTSSASPQPQMVTNQYVEQSEMSTEQADRAVVPLRIRNPFVGQSASTEMSKDVKWEAKKLPKPLVIHPISITR
jgi:hypothetical protein